MKRTYGTGTKIETEPGVWLLQKSLGTGPDGKRRRATKVHHGNKRSAELALQALGEDDAPVPKAHTVERLLVDWLGNATLAATTRADYDAVIRKWIVPAIGTVRVDKLTTRQVDDLYRATLAKVSASRVHRLHEVLSAAYNQAIKWQIVKVSPIASATPPTVRRKEIRMPDPADAQRILALADHVSAEFSLFVRLAALTGARRGELAGLKFDDLDLMAGTITIARSIVSTTATGTIVKETKTGGARRIALDHGTIDRIMDIEQYRSKFHPWIFSETVNPPRPDGLGRRYMRHVRRLGIDTHLHGLRHFMASQALVNGVDVRTVANRLGHSTSATTLGVYAQFVPAADSSAADLLAGLVD